MSLTRPVELLEAAVALLRQLVEATQAQPLRGLNDADLLTVEEVARRSPCCSPPRASPKK